MDKETANLVARIEEHCKQRNMAESTFGVHVVNDGKLVSRLRAGKSVMVKTWRAIEVALEADHNEKEAINQ